MGPGHALETPLSDRTERDGRAQRHLDDNAGGASERDQVTFVRPCDRRFRMLVPVYLPQEKKVTIGIHWSFALLCRAKYVPEQYAHEQSLWNLWCTYLSKSAVEVSAAHFLACIRGMGREGRLVCLKQR